MAQNRSDQVKAGSVRDGDRRIAVPQIVNSHILESSCGPNSAPWLLNSREVGASTHTRQNELAFDPVVILLFAQL